MQELSIRALWALQNSVSANEISIPPKIIVVDFSTTMSFFP
jgi:hypothetical protein